jgi:hypothetical protein
MGLERRGGKSYYYKKERVNGRVKSTYLAKGELAEMMARLQDDLRESRKMEHEENRARFDAMQAKHAKIDAKLDRALSLIQALTRAALLVTGHHNHKGQWRKGRNHASRSRPSVKPD